MDAVRMIGIVKCFGPVCANDGVDLIVGQQEIHCLLGENGAGKSTLMNILFGLYHPDAGEIFTNEKKVAVTSPSDTYTLRVRMVHQHFMLVNQLTALKNTIMGEESGGLFLNRKESRKKVEELVEWFKFGIDLQKKVVNLSVGTKQKVEIPKTLYRGADIVILDEPTAVLTPQKMDELFKVLRQLKENDKTVIFIAHRLNEAMSLSDRITVIRRGKVMFRCNTSSTDEKKLATQMVGRQVRNIVAKRGQKTDQTILELKGVRLHKRAGETVSLKVRVGEILGIAGMDGNGQQELEEMIVGSRRVREGEIFINRIPVQNMAVKGRKAMGLGYTPSDHHKNAMTPSFSVTEGSLLGYRETPECCRKGLIDYERLRQDAEKRVEELEIKVASVDQEMGQLSGGNQQRVILGGEISHDPGLVVVTQPVRGLDIGAIERVHETLLRLKKQGKAILLISAELSEVMNLSGCIAIFYEGEISARSNSGECTKEKVGLFMAGKKQEVRAREVEQQ